MEDILGAIVIGIIAILFLYFGYIDDYKRNPREFLKILVGVPLGIITSFLGILGVQGLLKKWIKKDPEKKQ